MTIVSKDTLYSKHLDTLGRVEFDRRVLFAKDLSSLLTEVKEFESDWTDDSDFNPDYEDTSSATAFWSTRIEQVCLAVGQPAFDKVFIAFVEGTMKKKMNITIGMMNLIEKQIIAGNMI